MTVLITVFILLTVLLTVCTLVHERSVQLTSRWLKNWGIIVRTGVVKKRAMPPGGTFFQVVCFIISTVNASAACDAGDGQRCEFVRIEGAVRVGASYRRLREDSLGQCSSDMGFTKWTYVPFCVLLFA